MSMLSKQCKELRAEAERIGYWSPTASRLMFDAADILWSLRNKNVALLGENEKLRERVRELEIEYDGATTAVLEKTERIEWIAGRLRGETNENERLRELFAEVWPIAEYAGYDHELARAHELMRELGIEVGE